MKKSAARVAIALLSVMTVFAVGCTATEETADTEETVVPAAEDSAAVEPPEETAPMVLTSASFEDGGQMAVKYARGGVVGGNNVSPSLSWSSVPEGTNSFALVMVDRHPVANEWVHWMVVDIPADAQSLSEGASASSMPEGARELENTWGEIGYGGPQPPAGSGDHDYEITLYALELVGLDLEEDSNLTEFLEATHDHTLGAATFGGYFGR